MNTVTKSSSNNRVRTDATAAVAAGTAATAALKEGSNDYDIKSSSGGSFNSSNSSVTHASVIAGTHLHRTKQ